VRAPLGHTVLQAPQPTHRCGSTKMPPPTGRGCAGAPAMRGALPCSLPFSDESLRIARAEQTSMHAVQPICSLRLCAHRLCWYLKNLGFSNSPTASRSSITAFVRAIASAA